MDYKDEYVLMHPNGKLFAGFTESGRRKHTDDFHRALVNTYDSLIGFCYEAQVDYKTTYSIMHVDSFNNNISQQLGLRLSVEPKNIDKVLSSVDESHCLIGKMQEFRDKHGIK